MSNAGKDGFKRSEAFEALENSLPSAKSDNAKLSYLGRVLLKMSSAGLLRANGRTWFITDKGANELRV